ncbi:hypothetical protein KR093_010870, partial [Drosophila rubida]
MGVKVKNPTSEQIKELRERFNKQYVSAPPAAAFHIVDLDRIRNDDVWLRRFLEMYDLDMEAAFNKLWETCVWRRSYGANDLHHSQLNQEYLNQGCVFVRGQDVDGKPLLIFRARLHKKSNNLDELIRIVVYWVERIQRENHMSQLALFFDMAGTGLATMDLDFVKRIVETFKLYYPNALNYILVYELGWALNAAFKVIKALLPPKAVEILKMISKKDITQYVSKDNSLVSWGGTDNYEYSFVPPPESKEAPKVVAANAGDAEQPPLDYDKKVHFAKMVLYDKSIGELHTPSDGMLQLEPSEYVNFCPATGESKLILKNITQQPIVYKIQTTSPEKFRVRPRCGVVAVQSTVEVGIWLKPDQQLSPDGKDKFLVMASFSPSADCASQEVAEIWKEKTTNDPDVENYRLICRQLSKSKDGLDGTGASDLADGKLGAQGIEEQAMEMSSQLRHTRNLQYVTLALIMLLFAGVGFLLFERLNSSAAGALGGAPTPTCQQ